jgi:hypothetical protein
MWRQVEYLHSSPGSHKSRQQGNPLPGIYSWTILFPGDINSGTCLSRLWESQIRESKIWLRAPRNSDLIMAALVRTSSNCKVQTHLVREGTHINKPTIIKIWSWPEMGVWHQDRLADCRLWHNFDFNNSSCWDWAWVELCWVWQLRAS